MRILNKIFPLAVMAALTGLCSCDDSTPASESSKTKVHFVMSTRAASGIGVATSPVEALEVERFNRYWVVFTDGTPSNNIVSIVKKECSLTEQDEFMVALSPGTYKVYAFANIDDSYLNSLGINEGGQMPDLSTTLFTPYNMFFGNTVTTLLPVELLQQSYESGENLGIPMTSINGQTVTITNAATVSSSIEVVRMFAKVEFVFSNKTSTDIVLRSQSISNLSVNNDDDTGFIPLYNNDSRSFDFLNGKPFKTLSHSYGAGLALAKDATNVSQAFYVLESQADETSNSFILDFNVVKSGETPTDATEYMRYALTDPNTLTAIRRNDWIRIPVTFNDWQMRLEARTYPPIGGYPEAEIDEAESNEFVVKFSGGGDFSIRPYIRDFNGNEPWFGIDNTARISGTPVISAEDTDGLFTTAPTLTTTGEIRGKMAVASGKSACITLSAKVITATTPSLVTKTLTRKIFVTQK